MEFAPRLNPALKIIINYDRDLNGNLVVDRVLTFYHRAEGNAAEVISYDILYRTE